MIYALRTIIETQFAIATVNAKVDLLNTLYGTSGAHVALLANGSYTTGEAAGSYPCVLYHVPASPMVGETARFNKRDYPSVDVALEVVDRVARIADSELNLDLILEAFGPIIDGLNGQTMPTTPAGARQILNADAPTLSVVQEVSEGDVVRLIGVARFTVYARAVGSVL